MNVQYYIGIDLGGTKTEAILLELDQGIELKNEEDPSIWVSQRIRRPTDTSRGYEGVLALLKDTILELERYVPYSMKSKVNIGIGVPGNISRKTGLVKNANTTCLNGRNLWGDLQTILNRNIAFENDANCLALAEATWGSARGKKVVFGMILGTGVGGAIAINREIWPGLQGIAGEWGHTILETDGRYCYCGKKGCVETYLSGAGMSLFLKEVAQIETSAIAFNRKLKSGDTILRNETAAYDKYLNYFAKASSQIINILDPEIIVIAGGLSSFEALYTTGKDLISKYIFNDECLTQIVPAKLGDAAGVYGAVLVGAPSVSK